MIVYLNRVVRKSVSRYLAVFGKIFYFTILRRSWIIVFSPASGKAGGKHYKRFGGGDEL